MDVQDDVERRGTSPRRALTDPATVALAFELLDELNATTQADDLVRVLLRRAVAETRSDRGVVSWIDGNEMVVAGCVDPFGELVPVGSRWPLAGDEVTAVALAAGRPEAGTMDAMPVDGLSTALRDTYAGLKHLLVVPVRVAGEDIAILCVSRRRSEEFAPDDVELLDLIADIAAQPMRAARLDDMLGSALAELSERLAGAESVERVKTDILRLASHELRGPLTVLHGYLSLVRGGFFGDLPEPVDRVMKILERRTDEMNGLVNDMLIAARIEDAPSQQFDLVDVCALVREAVADVAPRASAQHRLRVELPDAPVRARVDSERVVLALRNIIDNAVKYSPQGGDIVCRLSAEAELVRISVADRGLGIDPRDRERLFTRFGRVLTKANSHIPGIGLGLYFTREVARHHGGDVTLLDSEGPGCVFEMTLPLTA